MVHVAVLVNSSRNPALPASHPASQPTCCPRTTPAAGCSNIVVGFPADTVKVRLQQGGRPLSPYTSAWHCATSIVRYDGVSGWAVGGRVGAAACASHAVPLGPCQSARPVPNRRPLGRLALLQVLSLYRGLTPQLVGGALETGVNYTVYEAMLRLLQIDSAAAAAVAATDAVGPSQQRLQLLQLPEVAAVPLAAATAGLVLSFVLCPAELIKVWRAAWAGVVALEVCRGRPRQLIDPVEPNAACSAAGAPALSRAVPPADGRPGASPCLLRPLGLLAADGAARGLERHDAGAGGDNGEGSSGQRHL